MARLNFLIALKQTMATAIKQKWRGTVARDLKRDGELESEHILAVTLHLFLC
jgi:hypothetical protein